MEPTGRALRRDSISLFSDSGLSGPARASRRSSGLNTARSAALAPQHFTHQRDQTSSGSIGHIERPNHRSVIHALWKTHAMIGVVPKTCRVLIWRATQMVLDMYPIVPLCPKREPPCSIRSLLTLHAYLIVPARRVLYILVTTCGVLRGIPRHQQNRDTRALTGKCSAETSMSQNEVDLASDEALL